MSTPGGGSGAGSTRSSQVPGQPPLPSPEVSAAVQQAAAALSDGRTAEAGTSLEIHLVRHPTDPEFLAGLAEVRRRQGRRQDAVMLLEQALSARPQRASGWNNLGALRRETDDIQGALSAYERALELEPDSRNALYNLAALLHGLQHPERACALLRRLVALEPHDAGAWNLLGLAQSDADALDEALDSLARAVELAPEDPNLVNNLGVALGYAGRFQEARRAFERALALAPEFALAWENLVRTRRLTDADRPALQAMQQLLTRVPGNHLDAVCLHFGLGKAFDDLDETDRAFTHFRQGNGLMAVRAPYDPRAHEALVERVIRTCDARFLARCRPLSVADCRPVFVIGMPRSGTTLVEQILGRSPGVHAAGELPVVERAMARLTARAGAPYPAALEPGPGRDHALSAFAREVSEGVAAAGRGAPRVVDKMPGNYLYLGLIHALLPEATFIHCRRDPRDTGVSLYFHRFAQGHAFSYRLDHIAARYRSYRRLMAHWRALLGERLVEVDYDTLVRAPEETSRRLFRDSRFDWSSDCLLPSASRGVRTASSWQVRQPISHASSGRWRRYAGHLGPLLTLADEGWSRRC